MLLEKDINKILGHMADKEPIEIKYDGSDILLSFMDNASKLSLATRIYTGGNYIPTSVRRCVSHKSLPSFTSPSIKTFLTVDERHFQVHLNYLGRADTLTSGELKVLLEEFGLIAEKWRDYLDENDRNDLIYVRTK